MLEVSGVDNTAPSPMLNEQKRQTEARLREKYAGFTRPDFLALPAMAAYEKYYKRFGKTYHVLLQLESIALKGKNLPNVSPLVDANFSAEVETLVLTAGHDVAKLREPVVIDTAKDGDEQTQMNGAAKPIYPNDMIMRDAEGVCCSIIYGQDHRSPISSATTHALYVAYAPIGVGPELVMEHLRQIETSVRLFAPNVVLEQMRVIHAA